MSQKRAEYITNFMLKDYIGNHNPKEVIVLADSGYDDQRIENAIVKKKWQFIIALNKTRSVKSERENSNTPNLDKPEPKKELITKARNDKSTKK